MHTYMFSIELLANCGQNFRPRLHCWVFSLFDLWPRLGNYFSIDINEFLKWISNAEGLNSTSYKSTTSRLNRYNNTASQLDRYNYKVSSQNSLGYTADKYASYETTAVASELSNDTTIHTSSLEETNEYLEKLANNIYKDPNPRIIRQATTEKPVTLQQRVLIRYLQPPAVPPPGPLIIKEVRLRQPSPPSPLVIHEYAPPLPSPPPLILRERPPTPPPYVPSETIIRTLPAIPVPPRSVVIERFLPPPEKPRDIIIERWIPYGPQPVRRTIIEHAPPGIQYPQPSDTMIIYSAGETLRAQKFEKLGVTQEDPAIYVARDEPSLLEPATLVQQARNGDVIGDISSPVLSSSIYAATGGNTVHLDQSSKIINQGFSLSRGTHSEGIQLDADTNGMNLSNTRYSFSATTFIGDSASAGSAGVTRIQAVLDIPYFDSNFWLIIIEAPIEKLDQEDRRKQEVEAAQAMEDEDLDDSIEPEDSTEISRNLVAKIKI
ncbi:unnamed protein product [Rotaria sordida]|uniref:Uncharacterized protein n=1 Tax=Rotaria sordida TaxID=392033 RepID=A0A814E5T0_9BILA|nr:unnamed protein product [Rotaria sordida]